MVAVVKAPKNGVVHTDNPVGISVPRINVQKMQITLVGDSPLIIHRWSEKAKKEMLGKQMKKAKMAKEAKDPVRDFVESLYILSGEPEVEENADRTWGKIVNWKDLTFGFPSVGFKSAAVSACRFSDGVKMTEARGAFHVDGEFVVIEGEPTMREDMARVGMGTADIRYRGEFKTWHATLSISHNTSSLSPAEIINLFNLAGFGVGIAEWRPEKNGSYGRFHVSNENEVSG